MLGEQCGSSTTGKRTSTTRACPRASGRSASRSRTGCVAPHTQRSPRPDHRPPPQRTTYLHAIPRRSPPQTPRSGYDSPRSGQQTPREVREERWRQEAEPTARPTKVEMREMYKELGGRKARGKGKLGGTAGMRDRGGWGESGHEEL